MFYCILRYLCAVSLLCTTVKVLSAADVWRIQVPGLVEAGGHDAELILYHRDGAFMHGYMLTPTRDNLVHRVDFTPAPSSVWVDQSGAPIEVPRSMKSRYGYKKTAVFSEWKRKYFDGEIDLKQDPTLGLALSEGKLTGLVDVLFLGVDVPNSAGRKTHSIVYRLSVDAEIKDERINGTATIWPYGAADLTFGKGNPQRKIKISGLLDREFWKAKEDQDFAEGVDWPMAHGPYLTASAADFEGELVQNLRDARLVWVAEDPLPSGRAGAKSRGGFAMFPNMWKTIGYGGYGAPIIADNKAFVYVHGSDIDAIMADQRTARDPYVRQGLDPRALGLEYGMKRDEVYCFDLKTGKKLWSFEGSSRSLGRASKQGMASTPCYLDGTVYVRGMAGLYAFDADTGEKRWLVSRAGKVPLSISSAPAEGSVVAVGDTLVLVSRSGSRTTTVGIDPKSGEGRWVLPNAGGSNIGLPGLWEHDGEQYLLLPRNPFTAGKDDKDKTPVPETFLVVDPVNGQVVLESNALGHFGGQLLADENRVLGNWKVTPEEGRGKNKDFDKIGAAELGIKSAKILWQKADISYPSRRTLGILHKGIFYTSDIKGGFLSINATNGELLAHRPPIFHYSGMSSNWNWLIGVGDRILTDGLLMWTTGDQGLELIPGRLALDLTGGYTTPTKPAFADGRIVLRLGDKLVCYDLRLPKDYQTEVIMLRAKHALVGLSEGSADVLFRIRKDGEQLITLGAMEERSPRRGYLTTQPVQLNLSKDMLKGDIVARLGSHYEPWELNLARKEAGFEGTFTRKVIPLSKPLNGSGEVDGGEGVEPDGKRKILLYLKDAVAAHASMKKGVVASNLIINLYTDGDTITHASAQAGQVNQAKYEVDYSAIQLEGNRLSGSAIVLMRDDTYHDLNPIREDYIQSGEGGLLAVKLELDLNREAQTWKGTHSSTIGIAWQKQGKLMGELLPDEGQNF